MNYIKKLKAGITLAGVSIGDAGNSADTIGPWSGNDQKNNDNTISPL